MNSSEFKEVGHSGGQVKFTVDQDIEGNKSYQIGYVHNRPTPLTIFGVYALSNGMPMGEFNIGFESPDQQPGWLPVFIASDSEGLFGHQCPRCHNYWRTRGGLSICPYCRLKARRHQFLSNAQKTYVRSYCEVLEEAIQNGVTAIIDMDAVADAVSTEAEKPPFYYAEESQQNKFECEACGSFNDVLGKYVYCSICGTKNDLQEINKHFSNLREQINQSAPYEKYVKEAISAFDIYAASFGRDLLSAIPMSSNRKKLMESLNYHSLEKVVERLQTFFDINLIHGLTEDDYQFIKLMVLRRHVYEHLGGQVDQDYIDKSGDTDVVLRQSLRETQASVHRVLTVILKMAENLHLGFHDILKPLPEPIRYNEERKARMKATFS